MVIQYDCHTRSKCLFLPVGYMYFHEALDYLGKQLIPHYERFNPDQPYNMYNEYDDTGFKQARHLFMAELIGGRIKAFQDTEGFGLEKNYNPDEVDIDFWIDERFNFEQAHEEIFSNGCCKNFGNNGENIYYSTKKNNLDWLIFDYHVIDSLLQLPDESCYPPLTKYDYFKRTGNVIDNRKDMCREQYPTISFDEFQTIEAPPLAIYQDLPESAQQENKEEKLYTPRYLEFMQELVSHLNLSLKEDSPKKEDMVEEILNLWPEDLEKYKSPTKAKQIASLLRKPEEKDGGARKQKKKK